MTRIESSMNARETVNVNEFPEASACFTGFALPLVVGMPPLLSLRYFAESARSWTSEGEGTTDSCASVINTKANFVDQVCNIEYGFAVAKYLGDEISMNRCVLKFQGDGVMEWLTGLEAMPHLSEA